MPYNANKHELEILRFWEENKTFEKSVNERPADKPYVFYDGPPFATGLPHYGHIMTGTKKDVIPRYKTMQGYRVERQWGWDCHGLPIENLIEKELGLSGREEIEAYGIDKFNEACRNKVLAYEKEWKQVIPRMGRWIDMDSPYKTMDVSFMESVWWVFSELFKKGLIYEGKKPMHVCPRCVTPLSNFEVTQGYKDVKDLSVVAKFKITRHEIPKGHSSAGTHNTRHIVDEIEGDVFLLAWTTTPWTLPGNILIAVGDELAYTIVKHDDAYYIVAKDLVLANFEGKEYEVVAQVKGADLAGLFYEPLFPYFADIDGADNGFRVVSADFVTTDDGTGLVHLAPAFGTDDYEVFRKENVPFIQHVTMEGMFTDEVTDFAGMHVKPEGDHTATDVAIIKWLAHNGKLFSKKKYEHSYPHCWRCDTPLLNYATNSWFVEVTKMKEQLIANNQEITWVPEHIKDGRFGKWLDGVKDWSISRNRYWGTPIPIWKSDNGEVLCVGSVEELETLTGKTVDDLHKHKIDGLTIEKDGVVYRRIPDVLDTWFDSGSVPYGQTHYPFENKEKFEAEFPADFIAESQDQTRGWFYTLHVLATALSSGESSIPSASQVSAFKTCSVNGIILAEDGLKMSKRLNNYPDPMDLVEKYGADALRYYLLSAPVMLGESMNFSEDGVREVFNKVVNTLANVLSFYEMFVEGNTEHGTRNTEHVLDRWIVARLHQLVREVTEGMEAYDLPAASRPIKDFIEDLSTWWVRRSRDRFKGEDEEDKSVALATLREVLMTLSKIMAPFTPFIAEKIFAETRNLKFEIRDSESQSVHLQAWPEVDETKIETDIIEQMEMVRKICEMGNAARKEAGVPVRQVLGRLEISDWRLKEQFGALIASELNVKEVANLKSPVTSHTWVEKEDRGLKILLNTEITDELKKEGLLREVVRAVNQKRKEQGLTRDDRVNVIYHTDDELLKSVFVDFEDELKKSVLADGVSEGGGEEIQIDGRDIQLGVIKSNMLDS